MFLRNNNEMFIIVKFKISRCDREIGLIRILFLPGKGETKLCLNCQDVPSKPYLDSETPYYFGSNKNVRPFEKFRELFLHKFCSHAVGKDLRMPLTLRRPLRRKLRMRLFFDVSKVKESSF